MSEKYVLYGMGGGTYEYAADRNTGSGRLNEINSVAGPGNDYWKTLWKILGITYAAEFSSAICKDAGYQTIALQIEVFAKITILVLSLPVLSALLQTIRGFLV